jgi:hypothetical protein
MYRPNWHSVTTKMYTMVHMVGYGEIWNVKSASLYRSAPAARLLRIESHRTLDAMGVVHEPLEPADSVEELTFLVAERGQRF